MSGTCPYCGAPLNFGLKFCIVCGRQSADVVNKMGNLKTGARQAETSKRMDDSGQAVDYHIQKKTLRFGNKIRLLLTTMVYGFIAGTLFFCAVKVALEVNITERVQRIAAPLIEPIVQKCQEVSESAKKLMNPPKQAPSSAKKVVKKVKKGKKRKK
jgi:hypothetical protein